MNPDTQTEREHILTLSGLAGSSRHYNGTDITIGRQETTQNDIVIPDRTVSRTHCKLVYKDGFGKRAAVPKEWIAFLMLFHPRLARKAKIGWLPVPLRMLVISFLVDQAFYLSDLGSTYGTFVRIRGEVPLTSGAVVSVGREAKLSVLELWENGGTESLTAFFARMGQDRSQIHRGDSDARAAIRLEIKQSEKGPATPQYELR